MATQAKTKPLEWPICIIDFEATSLSKASYPIEVGVCLWTDTDLPARVWGTLIQPTQKWLDTKDWTDEAFALHGISQSDLHAGKSPEQVCSELLHFCAAADVVFCDGNSHDHHWHNQLVSAADKGSGIILASLQKMLFHHEIFDDYEVIHLSQVDRHRALPDAIDAMARIAKVIGVTLEIDMADIESDPIQVALATQALQP